MDKVAVLASGGLDSSVLVANLAQAALVFPLYVRAGLVWEEEEYTALETFLAALSAPNVHPVTSLSVSAEILYGDHWGITGVCVPGAGTEDSAVFLPGRNILLIGLASVWCSTHDVSRIAIGSLAANPFPDATPEFFENLGGILSQGLGYRVSVVAPFRGLHKDDLVRRNTHLPLHLTLTCMVPKGGLHCGACNKCHERQLAFARAGVTDYTHYAVPGG